MAHRVSATLLDECASCGGVWLTAGTFDRLIRTREEQSAVVGESHAPRLPSGSARAVSAGEVRYLRCPDCRQLMNRKNFAHTSGVIIDVCSPHGMWFDRDELGRIVTFVMSGGLDAARRQSLERLEKRVERSSSAGLGGNALDDGASTVFEDLLQMLADWLRAARRP